jgi:hypothetical protein
MRCSRRASTLAAERPFGVDIEGVVDLPVTDDPLTPYIPGFAAYTPGFAAHLKGGE